MGDKPITNLKSAIFDGSGYPEDNVNRFTR